MSTDPDPNKNPTSEGGKAGSPASQEHAAREVAEKAIGEAKEKLAAGVETFKKLDYRTRIYLVGLVVAVLFSIIFDVISISVKGGGSLSELLRESVVKTSVTAFNYGASGKLAVLSALVGIGLWIWNYRSAKKEAWVPLALAGCAGFSALMFLVLMLGTGVDLGSGGVTVDVDMKLLGFWLPFAGAITATVVSVKRILKPV